MIFYLHFLPFEKPSDDLIKNPSNIEAYCHLRYLNFELFESCIYMFWWKESSRPAHMCWFLGVDRNFLSEFWMKWKIDFRSVDLHILGGRCHVLVKQRLRVFQWYDVSNSLNDLWTSSRVFFSTYNTGSLLARFCCYCSASGTSRVVSGADR